MKVYALVLMLLVIPLSAQSRADWIANYTGGGFNMIMGSPGFATTDLVTGTFTFANVGDTQAKSFTLSSTVNGVPTVLVDIPNINNAAPVTINQNAFTWNGNSIATWNVSVFFNGFGGPLLDTVSITNAAGDLVGVDLGAPATNAIFGFSPGTFSAPTAVPEPTSMTLFCGACLLAGSARLRSRWRRAKI